MGWLEKGIAGVLILAGLALTLALTIGEGLIHRNRKPATAASEPALTPPEPMEAPALAALERFFEAPDLDGKAAATRNPARVRPLMEDYHQRRNHPFPTLGRVSPGQSTRFGETPCVLFEVEPFSGPRYPIAVVWDGRRFAVDWQALTAYGTVDWVDFVERRPQEPQTLRVVIAKVSDELTIPGLPAEKHQFRIEHRDDPQPLVAVADDALARAITPLIDGQRTPVTLELAWQPIGPGCAPVACILRLVRTGWSE